MNKTQKLEILQVLGADALSRIQAGDPYVIDTGTFQLVQFWLYGHECEYYFNTEPVLLRQVETDQEFLTFNQLERAIHEPNYSPAV